MSNNFSELSDLVYPGRVTGFGMTVDCEPFVFTGITGRSPPSQARKYVQGDKTSVIRTELIEDETVLKRMFDINPDDPLRNHNEEIKKLEKLKNDVKKGSPALIKYPTISAAVSYDEKGLVIDRKLVASNGIQTNLLYSSALNNHLHSPEDVLRKAMLFPCIWFDEAEDRRIDITSYEPDSSNTPRINVCVGKEARGNNLEGAFLVVRKHPKKEFNRLCTPKSFVLEPGKGIFVTTYAGGNEDPLIPFDKHHEFTFDTNSTDVLARGIYSALRRSNPQDHDRIYGVCAAVMKLDRDGNYSASRVNFADIVMGL